MIKKLIPDDYFKSIYDIPYDTLYAEGIRLILTDLDNTLISYRQKDPTPELLAWKEALYAKGFEVIIVSNSRKDRVSRFAQSMGVPFVKFSTKPLKRGIRKAIRRRAAGRYRKEEIVLLGDQLMTDIFGANRCRIKSILIEAVDKKTDSGPTRINRRLENYFLKRIRKKYPDLYKTTLSEYAGDENDSKKM